MDAASARRNLEASRGRLSSAPAVADPGIYALFLSAGMLGEVVTAAEGLPYIGLTDSSLESRNHLTQKSSGFSTLRRSIGAVLRIDLGLEPIRRSPGSAGQHFKFTPDGVERLSAWMAQHLDYGFVVAADGRDGLERRLIAEHQPPLNLKGWKNPQAASIKDLRSRCRAAACGE